MSNRTFKWLYDYRFRLDFTCSSLMFKAAGAATVFTQRSKWRWHHQLSTSEENINIVKPYCYCTTTFKISWGEWLSYNIIQTGQHNWAKTLFQDFPLNHGQNPAPVCTLGHLRLSKSRLLSYIHWVMFPPCSPWAILSYPDAKRILLLERQVRHLRNNFSYVARHVE